MRALVVGGAGFLGLNIVEALQTAGHEVAITRRRSSNTIFARRLKVPLLTASLTEPETLLTAMRGFDTVFLAAGHYPRLSFDTADQVAFAVSGIRNALDAARSAGVRRVVYTGSVVTIGRPTEDRPANEEDGTAEAPAGSTYFAVKIAMEQEALCPRDGLEVVVLCPTGCLGPYDYKVGTGFFVIGLASRKLPFSLTGRINVVDAGDVADAHVQAATAGVPGRRYILGSHNVTVPELVQSISERFGVPPPERTLPQEEAFVLATAEEERAREQPAYRPMLSREMVDMCTHGQFVDSSRADADLGMRHRPLLCTIDRSHEWYRRNGYLGASGAD